MFKPFKVCFIFISLCFLINISVANMYKNKYLILIFFIALCKISLSQQNLKIQKIHYTAFLKGNIINDTVLHQSNLNDNIEDGEYFIYYDTSLQNLWLNGVVINNKLEGNWEFRNKDNKIILFKMFSDGEEINIKLTENKFAQIYIPNKVYEYFAYYISAADDTLSYSLVTLNTTSQMYEVLHSSRFQGCWTFNYNKHDSLLLAKIYPWNIWGKNTICNITETENTIQIYPPRQNQFVFTEILMFPSVSPKNLRIGYKWESQILLPEDYFLKEWENDTFYHKAEITGKTTYLFQDNNIDCWIIKGTSFNSKFGTCFFTYLFNEIYGFVSLEWINYDKQKAVFELKNLTYLK